MAECFGLLGGSAQSVNKLVTVIYVYDWLGSLRQADIDIALIYCYSCLTICIVYSTVTMVKTVYCKVLSDEKDFVAQLKGIANWFVTVSCSSDQPSA